MDADGPNSCGRRPEGATPAHVDAMLRTALAAAADRPLESVPAARPRRAARPGDTSCTYCMSCTTALPLRLARTLDRPPAQLAEAAAARLRGHPHVAAARVERGGFVGVEIAPSARLAMVATAAGDGTAFLRGYLRYLDRIGADGADGADGLEDSAGAGEQGPASTGPRPPPPLHEAPTVEEARLRAREGARRLMRGAHPGDVAPPPVRWVGRTADSGAAGPAIATGDTSWRDPHLDGHGGTTPASRLLAVVGEASARFAFCRSATERPRPGEETGPGLPALPTAQHPGAWAFATCANPAFAVRYAHAHAVSTLRWVRDAQAAGAAGAPATGRAPAPTTTPPTDPAAAAALAGALFDGPLLLSAAVRRSEPHMLVRYLEGLATAYHEWRESGGGFTAETTGEPGNGGSAAATERLRLCTAAAGVLHAGLSLLNVSAPTRL